MPRLLPAVIATLLLAAPVRGADDPSPNVTEPPPYDQFLVIPLRIHLLASDELPEVNCHLTDDDVRRMLGKINKIWHNAGIHWGLESLRREPAARQNRFKLARELTGGENLAVYLLLMPADSRSFDGLHVYYIHQFAVNGVWLGDGVAFAQETAKLEPVEGGIDEPLPRVTAHELGHALGLQHRQARTNLLASGTTGTLLNAEEVATARAKAARIDGARSVAELKEAAADVAAKNERSLAVRYWTWLAEVPGVGGEEARKQVERLKRAP